MPSPLHKEPIYQQLHVALKTLLSSPEFSVGSRFLTERQVAERFEVSRITANKALASLVAEGRLEFRKGVGTFVKADLLDYSLRSLRSFTDMMAESGRKAETVVLSFDRAKEPVAVLGDEKCYVMERLRLVDERPVILEKRFLVERHCPGLKKKDLAGSIYAVWRDRYFLALAGAEQTIRAVNVKGREAELLEVKPGAAAILNTSIGYLDGRMPLWYEETLYRGDLYEFFNRVGYVEERFI
jgi:GntR family transcriptional regulator